MREVQMTVEQSRVYQKMENELVAELEDRRTGENLTVEAVNTLAKLMKLRQITSGFVGHSEGMAAVETLDDNPKFSELDEFIDELQGEKLVIACQFKEEIQALLSRYKDLGIAAIYGDESVQRRAENIQRFQTTDDLQIMVLQPQAAAHGITLTKAHYFVFLSLDYNFEYYYQTGKRIERLGQKNPMFVYHFLAQTNGGGQTIDHDLMEVLRGKSQDRDVLFNSAADIVEIADTLRQRLIQRANQKRITGDTDHV
jgi:SNF2 family DNA or RNA helicase